MILQQERTEVALPRSARLDFVSRPVAVWQVLSLRRRSCAERGLTHPPCSAVTSCMTNGHPVKAVCSGTSGVSLYTVPADVRTLQISYSYTVTKLVARHTPGVQSALDDSRYAFINYQPTNCRARMNHLPSGYCIAHGAMPTQPFNQIISASQLESANRRPLGGAKITPHPVHYCLYTPL